MEQGRPSNDKSRLIRVQVKEIDGSIRRANLRLAVSDISTDSRLRVVLTNDLTEDASGDVTYFASCLTEDDYRKFREEQGLLVEMSGFASMVDRMVDMAEADESGARFFTTLEVSGGNASLLFVEINAFKRLVHLKLKMTLGTDAQIRKHLSDQLKDLKGRLTDLSLQHDQAKTDLTDRKADVDSLHQQLEALRCSVNEKEATLTSNLNREVAIEKERSASEINSARMNFNAERQRIIDENSTTLRRLQNQVASLEYENKDLMERRHRNEANLLSMSEEVKRCQAEIQKLNRQISSMKAETDRAGEGAKELDQTVHRLQSQISSLEQENVRLNGQVTLKSEMLKTLSEEKSKMETSLAEKSQLVAKREATVKAVSQELVKANEASKKLQAEARRQTDKVKLSHKIVSEQEKLISKKDAELEDTRTQLRDQSEANREWLASKELLNRDIESKDTEIEQLRKTCKTNETVIQWLNKQLTAAKVRDPGLKIGPPPSSLLPSSVGSGNTMVAAQSSVFGTPIGLRPAPGGGKSMVASTPLVTNAAAVNSAGQSDEENQSGNPVLDPKYLQPSKSGNNNPPPKKTLTKKLSRTTFSPKQSTTPLTSKQQKATGQKTTTTMVESVYFS